jgi:glycine/serine hydroxymethyltransferase
MAFKATNLLPVIALQDAKRIAVQSKNYAAARASSWASGANADEIIDTLAVFKTNRDRLQEVAATPGIVQYARDQESDQAYDVVGEFNALVAAIDAFIAGVIAAIPTQNPDNYALLWVVENDGTTTARNFSGAQLASVITLLQAIDNAVV